MHFIHPEYDNIDTLLSKRISPAGSCFSLSGRYTSFVIGWFAKCATPMQSAP